MLLLLPLYFSMRENARTTEGNYDVAAITENVVQRCSAANFDSKMLDARRTLHRVVLCPPAPPERVRCTPKKRDEKGNSTACALAYRCVCV